MHVDTKMSTSLVDFRDPWFYDKHSSGSTIKPKNPRSLSARVRQICIFNLIQRNPWDVLFAPHVRYSSLSVTLSLSSSLWCTEAGYRKLYMQIGFMVSSKILPGAFTFSFPAVWLGILFCGLLSEGRIKFNLGPTCSWIYSIYRCADCTAKDMNKDQIRLYKNCPVQIYLCLNVICSRFMELVDHSLAAWSRAMIILCSLKSLLMPFASPVRAKNTWGSLFESLRSTAQEDDLNSSPVV